MPHSAFIAEAKEKPNPAYIHLNKPREFDKRFEELIAKYDTHEEAYQAVEDEYRQTFGEAKYSSYQSYRQTRRERIINDLKK